jgi:hypothetical protein
VPIRAFLSSGLPYLSRFSKGGNRCGMRSGALGLRSSVRKYKSETSFTAGCIVPTLRKSRRVGQPFFTTEGLNGRAPLPGAPTLRFLQGWDFTKFNVEGGLEACA